MQGGRLMSRRGGELYSRWAPAPWHYYVLRSDRREGINVTDPHYRSTVHAGSETYVKLNCYEWGTHSIEIRQRLETPHAQGANHKPTLDSPHFSAPRDLKGFRECTISEMASGHQTFS